MKINLSYAAVILTASVLAVRGLPMFQRASVSESSAESISKVIAALDSPVSMFSAAPSPSTDPAPMAFTDTISSAKSIEPAAPTKFDSPTCTTGPSEVTNKAIAASNPNRAIESDNRSTTSSTTTESNDSSHFINPEQSIESAPPYVFNSTISWTSTAFFNSTDVNIKGNLHRDPVEGDPPELTVSVVKLDRRATMQCGDVTFTHDEIFEAIVWGVSLQEAKPPQGRGRKDKVHPVGRFPHPNPDPFLTFNAECPIEDLNRLEYPLFKGKVYNKNLKHKKYGPYRVVYYREPGVVDEDKNPLVYFCGGLTHDGAEEKGRFLQCTVQLFDD
ncbi:unnamed protein product [Zymoseptoria tritici ST99CH_1A5]|uniref:Uncharacterized protein n=1 Tax=Zymoseptoria tritici ST99CH_1A5 TaxID=1276529 RepID=A0A1Y6L6A1_ZYMTR|nr:unnamed protein product [Zymoseptoria tritici ST99CH_1A5]